MAEEQEQGTRISPQDVDAVAEKLKEWVPTLPEQEQLIIGWVLNRAAAAGDVDVEGYADRPPGQPVSALMAEAAGLQDVTGHLGGEVVVRWVYRF